MRYLLLLPALLLGLLFWSCGSKSQTSPGGFKYTVHNATGGATGKVGEFVSFHLILRTADTTLMDSHGQEQPFQVRLEDRSNLPEDQKQDPVLDVLPLLAIGDSVTIEQPVDSMMRQIPVFAKADVIYYDLVVVDIESEEAINAKAAAARKEQSDKVKATLNGSDLGKTALMNLEDVRSKYQNKGLGDMLKSTESGLEYVIHKAGTGTDAAANKLVSVQYIGMLLEDGSIFDNSYLRGQPIQFPLGQGQVIPGWDEGIDLLKAGSEATLIIPSELAYGERGAGGDIPPNSKLLFYVALENVEDLPEGQ